MYRKMLAIFMNRCLTTAQIKRNASISDFDGYRYWSALIPAINVIELINHSKLIAKYVHIHACTFCGVCKLRGSSTSKLISGTNWKHDPNRIKIKKTMVVVTVTLAEVL